jgi:hypothetical protein
VLQVRVKPEIFKLECLFVLMQTLNVGGRDCLAFIIFSFSVNVLFSNKSLLRLLSTLHILIVCKKVLKYQKQCVRNKPTNLRHHCVLESTDRHL